MFYKFLSKVFLRFSQYATEPEDSDEWRLKKIIGVASLLMGTLSYVGYSVLYYANGEPVAGAVLLGGFLFNALTLLTYGIFRHYAVHWYLWMATIILLATSAHVILGGFVLSGMVIVYLILIPIEMTVAYKPRHGLALFPVVGVIIILASVLQPYYLRDSNNLPQSVITALYVINILGTTTYMLLGFYYYVWQNEMLSRLVSIERDKAETLLLNVLPQEIAAILKDESRVIADQFDGVSVLFADIVDFTPMSANMTPVDLVELLNDVFSYFDSLAEKYEVEKIKTIGDCYMVAAGVPSPRSDHARVLTRLALEMKNYVAQHEFRGKRLTFRIGLNSGPVVAGVIGRKKFIYDLWGDAVNTASRMESHGTGGFIQITESTYELIKNDFVCEPRGEVNVKGKGKMKVWYVLSSKM